MHICILEFDPILLFNRYSFIVLHLQNWRHDVRARVSGLTRQTSSGRSCGDNGCFDQVWPVALRERKVTSAWVQSPGAFQAFTSG